MLVSEAKGDWRPVPNWIEYLIQLGYGWPRDASECRRIALVSMPCDSPAAGLISLGALIRDLGRPDANDVFGHYDALLRHARQYLESCRHCADRCHPDRKGCGYVQEAKGGLRSVKARHKFVFADATNLAERKLVIVRETSKKTSPTRAGTETQIHFPASAPDCIDLHIEGEPPVVLTAPEQGFLGDIYARFVENTHIEPANLRTSYCGLCLAGRSAGEAPTRQLCASIHFRYEDTEHSLLELLALKGSNNAQSVSRLSIFNSRTGRFDRLPSPPALVVADGGSSFIRVLGESFFQHSNVVAVVHRTLERDDLEAVGNRIAGLRQWYTEDSEMLEGLPSLPRGISIMILKKS